jgi:hypothetical protein
MFILEHPLKNKEFFAATVGVGGEFAVGRITHDGCSSGYLIADAIKHAAVNAPDGRRRPLKTRSVNRSALGEIGVQFHGAALTARCRSLQHCAGVWMWQWSSWLEPAPSPNRRQEAENGGHDRNTELIFTCVWHFNCLTISRR